MIRREVVSLRYSDGRLAAWVDDRHGVRPMGVGRNRLCAHVLRDGTGTTVAAVDVQEAACMLGISRKQQGCCWCMRTYRFI